MASISSDSAKGCPCVNAITCSSNAPEICSTSSRARTASGKRLRNETTRSRSRQPGSERHRSPGGRRPAITTRVPAGSVGRNSSRSQSSADSSRSAASIMTTVRFPRESGTAARIPAGVGRIRPPSMWSTVKPALRAASAQADSKVDLPMPPGPCTHNTLNRSQAVSPAAAASSRAAKSSSSAVRPTKRRDRARSSR